MPGERLHQILSYREWSRFIKNTFKAVCNLALVMTRQTSQFNANQDPT